MAKQDFKFRINRSGKPIQNFESLPDALRHYIARLTPSLAKKEPLVIEEISSGAILLANFYAVPQKAAPAQQPSA